MTDFEVVRWGIVGPGRIAAFGFSPLDLSGQWSKDNGRAIFMNTVRWAAGRPLFQIALD